MAFRNMRLGVPLSQLRTELLAETFQSPTPAQTVNLMSFYNYQLARVQREQWNDVIWPHMKIWMDLPMVAGQRFYDYPPGFGFDALIRIWWPQGVNWVELAYGIEPPVYATMGGELVRAWPPRRWQNRAQYDPDTNKTTPASQFEVWPIPPENYPYSLRLEATAPLNDFIADTDVCVLDATLLVMMAAAEILLQQKNEAAQMKLQKATAYKRMLVARVGAQQRQMRSLSRDGGDMQFDDLRRLTPWLDFIPMYGGPSN
jgi:hypothetical protein